MYFNFDGFTVEISKKEEELNDRIAVPSEIKNGKAINYVWKYRTREFNVFSSLAYKSELVIDQLFDFIELVELLKAFSNNKLDTKKEYCNNSFSAQIAQKDGEIFLKIEFAQNSQKKYFTKFECISIASKFSKILQRCEAWQE